MEKMKPYRTIGKAIKSAGILVILLCAGLQGFLRAGATENGSAPVVVLGIVVENMRPDYIGRYWDKFGNDGFRKLVQGGSRCVHFRINQHILNGATGTATLFTGVTPSVHGIIDEAWYDRSKGKVVSAVADDRYTLTGGTQSGSQVSPLQLKASTLGDQLKLSGHGQSRVFSIALNEAPALFAAGFSGDAAWWLDNASGRMVTSSFYTTTLPEWVKNFNDREMVKKYATRNWVLLKSAGTYSESTEDRSPWEAGYGEGRNIFPHSMASLVRSAGHYGPLKTTPFGNSLVREFAVELLEREEIGQDRHPDLVTVVFSSMDMENSSFGPGSVEMEDLYLRLDEEIATLITFAEKKFGKEKMVVFLTGNSSASWPAAMLREKFRFPAGTFSPDNAAALLNSWLNITYGDLKWIEYNNGLQLYLNHKIAAINHTDLREMRRRTAEFLSEFEGVRMAVSSDQIRDGQLSDHGGEGVVNSWFEGRSGDILLVLHEGWQTAFKQRKMNQSGHTHVPLLFYGYGIPAQTLYESYEAEQLVPTLSGILGISTPPGSHGRPIPLFRP